MRYQDWISESGAPWPAEDEFRMGAILEHAGYYLTWLTAFFGPAVEMSVFTETVALDKHPMVAPADIGPDFTVATIRFATGALARLTCTGIMPRDSRLRIAGTDGLLAVDDCFVYDSPVTLRRRLREADRERRLDYLAPPETLRHASPGPRHFRYADTHDMDFARGVDALARALLTGSNDEVSAEQALHVLEIVLAILEAAGPRTVSFETSFKSLQGAPWAQ
jgi:predicted dehydrogenase